MLSIEDNYINSNSVGLSMSKIKIRPDTQTVASQFSELSDQISKNYIDSGLRIKPKKQGDILELTISAIQKSEEKIQELEAQIKLREQHLRYMQFFNKKMQEETNLSQQGLSNQITVLQSPEYTTPTTPAVVSNRNFNLRVNIGQAQTILPAVSSPQGGGVSLFTNRVSSNLFNASSGPILKALRDANSRGV